MDIRISSLASRSGGEEIEVTFEINSERGGYSSRSSFIISSKQYLTIGLSKGTCDTEIYDTVSRAADVWDCVKRGMYLLGFGTCSEKALKTKLASKGYDKEIAGEAVEELIARGFLRPFDDALRTAEKMAERLWGSHRIAAGLYEKGYSAETVNYAINALEDGGIDYVSACVRLIRKKCGNIPEDTAAYRKLFASLVRYGYSSTEIKEAFDIVRSEI